MQWSKWDVEDEAVVASDGEPVDFGGNYHTSFDLTDKKKVVFFYFIYRLRDFIYESDSNLI